MRRSKRQCHGVDRVGFGPVPNHQRLASSCLWMDCEYRGQSRAAVGCPIRDPALLNCRQAVLFDELRIDWFIALGKDLDNGAIRPSVLAHRADIQFAANGAEATED